MGNLDEAKMQALLTPETRAGLPFLRLLRLYLDPGALFMDASRGPTSARRVARNYNRRMRWMLVPYIRRWGLIAATLFLAIEPAQAMSCIPAAACAVSGSIAATVIAVTSVAYFLLGVAEG